MSVAGCVCVVGWTAGGGGDACAWGENGQLACMQGYTAKGLRKGEGWQGVHAWCGVVGWMTFMRGTQHGTTAAAEAASMQRATS